MQGYTSEAEASTDKEKRETLREALIGHKAQRALAFQTAAVRRFGPAAGIFARQLLFWDGKGRDPEDWIYKSIDQFQEETGLSRRQQEVARNRLKGGGKGGGKGVLEEKRDVGPDGRWRLFYRLDLGALLERLGDDLTPPEDQDEPSTSAQGCSLKRAVTMPTLVSSDHAHLSGPTKQKSTQEKTHKNSPRGAAAPQEGIKVSSRDRPDPSTTSSSPLAGETEPQTKSASRDASPSAMTSQPGHAKEAVTRLAGRLDLDEDERKKYGKHFKDLLAQEEVGDDELREVTERIVDEWGRIALTPRQALRDVRGGSAGHQQNKPTPEAGIEAIRNYNSPPGRAPGDGVGPSIAACRENLAQVARRWDFTGDGKVPMKIRYEISERPWECDEMLDRLRLITRRAVRAADVTELERPLGAAVSPADARIRSEGLDAGDEGYATLGADDESSAFTVALRRVAEDPDHPAVKLAWAVIEGKGSPHGPITQDHVADRLREDLDLDALDMGGVRGAKVAAALLIRKTRDRLTP